MKAMVFFFSVTLLFASMQSGGRIRDGLERLPLIGRMFADIKTKVNDTFTVELEQALHPRYEWKCVECDEGYSEIVDEGFRAPSEPGRMGVTVRYFTFRALKNGSTELKFAYGTIAPEGLKDITKEESYTVYISG
jgi:hypothetical protein